MDYATSVELFINLKPRNCEEWSSSSRIFLNLTCSNVLKMALAFWRSVAVFEKRVFKRHQDLPVDGLRGLLKLPWQVVRFFGINLNQTETWRRIEFCP